MVDGNCNTLCLAGIQISGEHSAGFPDGFWQANTIKEKAEELYKYAIEKGTPVVENAADEVRKQALKVVKEIQKKLEEKSK